MFAKLHLSVPKKEFVVPLLPNIAPHQKFPVSKRLIAHHVRAERAGSVAAEKVEEELRRAGKLSGAS